MAAYRNWTDIRETTRSQWPRGGGARNIGAVSRKSSPPAAKVMIADLQGGKAAQTAGQIEDETGWTGQLRDIANAML